MAISRALRRLGAPIAGVTAIWALTLADPARSSPLGVEFQVNVYTTGAQFEPVIALDSAGNFVVVWDSQGQDGDTYGVFGRRFAANGSAIGAEFQVTAFTTSVQRAPDVARDSDGDTIVVWQSNQDGQLFGVFAQRIDATGVKQGAELQVNTYTLGLQTNPSVAMDIDGDFVVVWGSSDGQDGDDYGVFAKRFSSAGAAQGVEFQVNSQTVHRQRFPAVAMEPDGDFVVVWDDDNTGDVMGRRVSAAGVLLGAEFQVNSYTPQSQSSATVAVSAAGDFAVVWTSFGQDGSDFGVYGRRFNALAVPQGSDFPINASPTGAQGSPQVSMNGSGDFVVIWQDSAARDGDVHGVFGMAFNEFGIPQERNFQVNSYTVAGQFLGDVAVDPSGGAVITWLSLHDGSSSGVFARRYSRAASSGSIDVDGDGEAEPLTDGILLLRYLFGFRGATLIGGAVAGDCTRCTAPLIEAFLDALGP